MAPTYFLICLHLILISFECATLETIYNPLVRNQDRALKSTFPSIAEDYIVQPTSYDAISQFTLNFLQYVRESKTLGKFFELIVDDTNEDKTFYDGAFHYGEALGVRNPQVIAQSLFDTMTKVDETPILMAYATSYSDARLLNDYGFLTSNNVGELSRRLAKSLENSIITTSGKEAVISGIDGEMEFLKQFNILNSDTANILLNYAEEGLFKGKKLGILK